MKSLVVYYSFSGNTKEVAQMLHDVLSQRGVCDLYELKPKDESTNFFIQANRAFCKARARLDKAPYDVCYYDLICVGTPVWAFGPAPAVNTYLEGIIKLEGKDALCFMTYGSGLGANLCIEKMKKALKTKGAFKLFSFGIQQGRADDKSFVKEQIVKYV